MNLTAWLTEAFYSPVAFFRLRKNHTQSFFFTQFFLIGAYFLILNHLCAFFLVKISFFALFFSVIFLFLGGFVKAGVFFSLINFEKPQTSFKDIWFIQALGLFPLYLTLPLLPFFDSFLGIGLLWIVISFTLSLIARIYLYRKILKISGHFVWISALIQGFLVLFLLFFFLGLGMAFLSQGINELIQGFLGIF